jgi:hypothetical protein
VNLDRVADRSLTGRVLDQRGRFVVAVPELVECLERLPVHGARFHEAPDPLVRVAQRLPTAGERVQVTDRCAAVDGLEGFGQSEIVATVAVVRTGEIADGTGPDASQTTPPGPNSP